MQRIALMVLVDLDPVPGMFHTREQAKEAVESILLSRVGHYNPVVFEHVDQTIASEAEKKDELAFLDEDQRINYLAMKLAMEHHPHARGISLSQFASDYARFIKEGR